MKKYLIVLLAIFALSACNKQQELAMKSADKDYILKVANENFEKKKWSDALALYERLSNLVACVLTCNQFSNFRLRLTTK